MEAAGSAQAAPLNLRASSGRKPAHKGAEETAAVHAEAPEIEDVLGGKLGSGP